MQNWDKDGIKSNFLPQSDAFTCLDASFSGPIYMRLHGKSMPISGLKHCYWPEKFEKQTHDSMHNEVMNCMIKTYINHAYLAYLCPAAWLFANTPNMKRWVVKKIQPLWPSWACGSDGKFYALSVAYRWVKPLFNLGFYKKPCCLSVSNRFFDMASLSFLVYLISVKTCAKVSFSFIWQNWMFSGRLSFSW